MSFFESRISWAFAFSPKTTYFVPFSGPDMNRRFLVKSVQPPAIEINKHQKYSFPQEIPEVNLWRALLILTDVELIPPHRPLSEEIVTITFFFTSTPSNAEKQENKMTANIK